MGHFERVGSFEDAPEVAPSNAPIPSPRDNEGLQAVEHAAPEYNPNTGPAIATPAPPNPATPTPVNPATPTAPSSGSTSSSSSSSSPTTTSPAAVTSGQSGLAAYSCSNQTTYTTTDDDRIDFTEECNVLYAKNAPNYYYRDQWVDNLANTTVYRFEDCMNDCSSYNRFNLDGTANCRAVTYYANLTQALGVSEYGGNCFLKDGRGVPNSVDPNFDWTHTASAWMTCLEDDACIM
ncbi:hypothetical protein K431DRAFT_150705 [Polychaeton citri CBS 116435]|uniref:Apple domain-containing protein n=1 Tax=Polychaeton citri CBS 116435 TaxID=1314669 RepID=A0A9P4Q3E7_9PEZI|nr:hypothetical protein K431DRAFT_150705 [Polychaeton citri CBS 116435]